MKYPKEDFLIIKSLGFMSRIPYWYLYYYSTFKAEISLKDKFEIDNEQAFLRKGKIISRAIRDQSKCPEDPSVFIEVTRAKIIYLGSEYPLVKLKPIEDLMKRGPYVFEEGTSQWTFLTDEANCPYRDLGNNIFHINDICWNIWGSDLRNGNGVFNS